MNGFIFIDKPGGPTSHDVVDRIRALLQPQTSNLKPPKVGHSGTLDPFATGLLIIGVGRATKELGRILGLDKEYEAELQLGAISDTYDRTGAITPSNLSAKGGSAWGGKPQTSTLSSVLARFVGTLEQIPPMYSAKKVRGKKLYELARQGIEIQRQPARVQIFRIEILRPDSVGIQDDRRLAIRVRCSSGTYIRSLAHDIGQALGCGAYLEELRRTAIGPFTIAEAIPLGDLTSKNLEQYLRPIPKTLDKIEKTH